ncbi:hypothetical protein AB0O67_28990 [Streptomyces sp. NPDC086077]|uniref:hypothetical protein n=1 Tax=Streptomyces sp. NPDC086077 TaxID=3154862 RepID=UPI003431FDB8
MQVFAVTVLAVCTVGYVATEAINISMEPGPTGSVSDTSIPAPVVPAPECSDTDADFTACALDRMTCEESAAHYRAHPSPGPSPARITVRLCADGTQAED